MDETRTVGCPTSTEYFVQRGGICRSLELILLIAAEICLGVTAALESNKGLFHQIILAFPIGTILLIILSHLFLGPQDNWPRLRWCSWAKVETGHDILMFALLLPSSLALLVPPFTRLEVAAAVLTLVMVLLVAFKGVDNFHKGQQQHRRSPLVVSSVNIPMSQLRRQRRKSVPNTPFSFSPRLIPCSTPVVKSPDHQSLSPQSGEEANDSLLDAASDATLLLNRRLNSSEWASVRESPMRSNSQSGPESRSRSHKFRTFTVSPLATASGNKSDVSKPISQSASLPEFAAGKNEPFSTSTNVTSPSPNISKKVNLDGQGLTFICKHSSQEESSSKIKLKSIGSLVTVPMINLIEPSPELKFPSKRRLRESEMGSSPLLRESDIVLGSTEDQNSDSPLLCSSVFNDLKNPDSVNDVSPEYTNHPVGTGTLPSNPRDALMEELERKLLVGNNLKSRKNTTSVKSVNKFSPPKTSLGDNTKLEIRVTPQITPRQSIKVKDTVVNGTLDSCHPSPEVSPVISSFNTPISRTANESPSVPTFPTDYVRVYPSPKPFLGSHGSTPSLSNNLPSSVLHSSKKDSTSILHNDASNTSCLLDNSIAVPIEDCPQYENTTRFIKAENTPRFMKFENNTGLVKTENTTRLVKSENTPGLMNSENTPGLVKSENTPKLVKAETTARLMKTEQRGKNTLEMLKVEVLGENLSSSTNVCQFQRPTNTSLAAAENLRSDEEVTPFREEQGELITDL